MSAARRFADELLAGCPAREVLLMCVSELCSNAIVHTDSGNGGVFIVEVTYPRDGVARVAVTDEGGPSVPSVRPAGRLDVMAEGGRGLTLVAACTSRWGYADAYPGRTVWAEASWPVPVPSPARAAPAGRPHRSRSAFPSSGRGSRDSSGRGSRDWPPRDLPPRDLPPRDLPPGPAA